METGDLGLTEEENDEYYDHGEKHFVPESRHPAPDPQLENALPSAQTVIGWSLWCTVYSFLLNHHNSMCLSQK